jgi:hypothetical protein
LVVAVELVVSYKALAYSQEGKHIALLWVLAVAPALVVVLVGTAIHPLYPGSVFH